MQVERNEIRKQVRQVWLRDCRVAMVTSRNVRCLKKKKPTLVTGLMDSVRSVKVTLSPNEWTENCSQFVGDQRLRTNF